MKCFTLEMTEQSFEAHLNVNCAWCQCDKMIWLEAFERALVEVSVVRGEEGCGVAV